MSFKCPYPHIVPKIFKTVDELVDHFEYVHPDKIHIIDDFARKPELSPL